MALGTAASVENAETLRRIAEMRARLSEAQTEAVTGRRADPVRDLGGENGERIGLDLAAARNREAGTALGLARATFRAAQGALGSLLQTFDGLSEVLVSAIGGVRDRGDLAIQSDHALSSLRSTLNTTFAGRYLFSGEAVDTASLAEPDDALAALDALFTTRFGFSPDDVGAASLSIAQVNAFLDDAVAALTGSIFDDHLSGAAGPTALRLDANETLRNDVTADDDTFREGVAAALLTGRFARSNLSDAGLGEVTGRALDLAAQAGGGVAELQGRLGTFEARVGLAVDSANFRADSAEQASDEMVGVDAFEAATRFNQLVTQLETAFALTGRLSELSLLAYLPR